MNKLFSTVVLFVAPIYLHAQALSADTWASCEKNKKGEIILLHINAPFVAEKINGERKGICVEVMSEFVAFVKAEKGIDLKVKNIDAPDNFSKFLDVVTASSGGVFGVADVTITDERKKQLKFSPAYMNNFPVLVTNNVIPRFQKEEEIFKNYSLKTAYTVKNTIHEKRVFLLRDKFNLNINIEYLPSSIEILEKIANDRTSFALVDAIFYLEAVKKSKPISVQMLKGEEFEEYGVIMPKNSDWDPIIKEFFERNGGFIQSTRYKKILFDNIGATGVTLFTQKTSKK